MPRRGGRPSRQYLEDTKRMQEKRQLREVGMLTGGQAKIAAKAPPTNKIDEKDFAVLRAEKAKGRGMGLQDEKVKPGKVMKAKRGKAIEKLAKKKGLPVPLASSIPGGTKKGFFKAFGQFPAVPSKGRLIPLKKDTTKAISSVKPSTGGKGGPPSKTPKEARSAVKDFMARRKKLAGVGSMLGRAGRIGLFGAALGVAGAGAAKLGQTIGRKMSEKKNKKMGGGMMKRPMAYTKGGGADTGSRGELKSKLGVLSNKVKRTNKILKERRPKLQAPERGPMKPLQAKKGRTISTRGGGVDSGTFGKIRDAGPFRPLPTTPPGGFKPIGPETSQRLKKLMDRKNRREKIKSIGKAVLAGASPVTGAISGAYKLAQKMKDKDRLTDRDIDKAKSMGGRSGSKNRPIKKDHDSRNPNPKTPKMYGGGMMKPMGYKSGKSIKVKCKLGKNKPTKMY